MARSIDPLVVGKVIGDVIDTFVPSVDIAIHYSTRQVGHYLDPLCDDVCVAPKQLMDVISYLAVNHPRLWKVEPDLLLFLRRCH